MEKTGKATVEYARLVSEAENAVAAVKDPELRRVAFEKILETLLGRGSSGADTGKRASSGTKPRVAGKRPAAKKGGPQAYVEELVEEGFFKTPRTIAHVKAELANRGHHVPLTSLSGPLQNLCKINKKVLRRQRTRIEGNRRSYCYSNW